MAQPPLLENGGEWSRLTTNLSPPARVAIYEHLSDLPPILSAAGWPGPLLLGLGPWNVENETRTPPRAQALRANVSAVEFDEILHDGKAQAKAALCSAPLGLPKWLENVRQGFRINTFACVLDAELEMTVQIVQARVNGTAPRRELDG